MTTLPFAALCAYDRRALGANVAEIVCMQPITNEGASPFGLYARGEDVVGLRGHLDIGSDLFADALVRADPPVIGGIITVDATELAFIDHRALLALAAYARRRRAGVVVRSPSPGTARLVGLLDIDELRVELVA